MPNHLSVLGIIHTAISIFAIMVAVVALLQDGKLSPTSDPGKGYIILTILTCLTALPIMKTGHATAGHYVAITILVLLVVGIYAKRLRVFGKLTDYVQVVAMSATLFLSCIPAIVETLTRVPISHPVASGPNDPMVQMSLNILAVLFLGGVIFQVVILRSKKKKAAKSADGSVNTG